MPPPLIVIPALNEEAHLPALLDLFARENPDSTIVVCDGGSRDRSIEIIETARVRHPNIHLLRNAKRLQSVAVNLAAKHYGRDHDWMVRVDAHCLYPPDYVETLLTSARDHRATNVVVPMVTRGNRCFQRGVAAAQNSVLGTGGSPHRHLGEGRFVDHGHHALFDLRLFRAAGGYDGSFSHNEDAELDVRLGKIGARIWLEPAAALLYEPRATAGALLRQYFRYGEGRAKTVFKHQLDLKARQALPLLVAPALLTAMIAIACSFLSAFSLLAAIPVIAWAILCQSYAMRLAIKARSICVASSGCAAMIMHTGWSLGYWAHCIRRWTLPPRGR